MEANKIIISLFVYSFFILVALGLISLVIPYKKRPKNTFQFIKIYWSEVLLIGCMILGAYFMIRGMGI
ncbi:hypothetical protein HYW76_02105 [Candidatus Pacearchaeota archaeon]|nr:hypothetical protein [Candidatus Pacearchaeota archaeon]